VPRARRDHHAWGSSSSHLLEPGTSVFLQTGKPSAVEEEAEGGVYSMDAAPDDGGAEPTVWPC